VKSKETQERQWYDGEVDSKRQPAQGIVLQLVLLFVSNRDSTGKDKKDNES
jgi:hypothetical protein